MATLYWNYGDYHYTVTASKTDPNTGDLLTEVFSYDSNASPAKAGEAAMIHVWSFPVETMSWSNGNRSFGLSELAV
jgi:hypothetical protein